MLIHHQLPTTKVLSAAALAIGTFDGVHQGHRQLISRLRQVAAERQLPSVVLTFVDMPHCYFFPDDCPHLLTLAEEKIALFAELEIDHLWIVPFNEQIAAQEYDAFVDGILVKKMGMRQLLAGPDFALGKARRGNLIALRELGKTLLYDVEILERKYFYNGAPVSSTRIRTALEAGQVADANAMLTHPYRFSGRVVTGRGLGREMNMPTVNIELPTRKVRPAAGVYAARARLDDSPNWLPAALSIGTNSSVGGTAISVEFHVIGHTLTESPRHAQVEMVAWHRAQEHFDNMTALQTQMHRDVAQIAALLR